MALYSRFHWWLLAVYMTAGAVLWPLYIAFFAQVQPRPESLGDAGSAAAWRMIVFGGAGMGAMTYLGTLLMTRLAHRRRSRVAP